MSAPIETIAAIATASGRAGVGVVRISGPLAPSIGEAITGRVLAARQATLATFLASSGEPIDRGIAIRFASPASYTGEDVVELQGHGGDAVLARLLRRCIELGARLANPGEFTQRAFLNDKLDLAQAESVADLIDAASEGAARAAARSLVGEFSAAVHRLADGVTELRALVEATIDFPEEDVDFISRYRVEERLDRLRAELRHVLRQAEQGSALRKGLQVVLVGEPNVGKSSLLNALSGEDVAIVTPIPGTTRDAVRNLIQVEGVPIHLIDTAGLREAADPVEQLGIERTWQAAGRADVVLLIEDARTQDEGPLQPVLRRLGTVPRVRVVNKIDLSGDVPRETVSAAGEATVYLSAKTGAGVELLRRCLLALAGWQPSDEGVFMARERHLAALNEADHHIGAALKPEALELMAEELRQAHRALGRITGEVTSDDLLGEIFSRFCIGK